MTEQPNDVVAWGYAWVDAKGVEPVEPVTVWDGAVIRVSTMVEVADFAAAPRIRVLLRLRNGMIVRIGPRKSRHDLPATARCE